MKLKNKRMIIDAEFKNRNQTANQKSELMKTSP